MLIQEVCNLNDWIDILYNACCHVAKDVLTQSVFTATAGNNMSYATGTGLVVKLT